MKVKRYLARNLGEAMTQVKNDLGPDAIIVHTHPVKVGGFLGLFATKMVEVTAASDTDAKSAAGAALRATQGAAAQQLMPEPPVMTPALAHMQAELGEVSALVKGLVQRMELPDPVAKLGAELQRQYTLLVDRGVDSDLAQDLVTRIQQRISKFELGEPQAAQLVREVLAKDMGTGVTIEVGRSTGRVVALVGPTGVGKTTTLAKLAAQFAMGRRMDVALITADTYRIAAVEQLRTYSEILRVPLEVAYTTEEMAQALARHRHRDLILVDSAGRSPRNQAHMLELQQYLQTVQPHETYLVLSLTSSFSDLAHLADSYDKIYPVDRFLFTKLDEAASPGTIYNLVHRYKKPLSYVTTGQNVPEDIEVAEGRTLARYIMGENVHA